MSPSILRRLTRAFFEWYLSFASEDELAGVNAIVTQASCRDRKGGAGFGNEVLRDVVVELHRKCNKPVIPQHELRLAIGDRIPEGEGGIVAVTMPPAGTPIGESTAEWNTKAVARHQLAICKDRGWKKIALIALGFHGGRAKWTYEMAALEMGLDIKIYLVPVPKGARPYVHPTNAYLALRSVPLTYVREFVGRVIFLLKRWI